MDELVLPPSDLNLTSKYGAINIDLFLMYMRSTLKYEFLGLFDMKLITDFLESSVIISYDDFLEYKYVKKSYSTFLFCWNKS